MGSCSSRSESNGRIDGNREILEILPKEKSRVESVGSGVLPRNISRIVGEYLGDHNRYYVESSLSGTQPITLCFSQDVHLRLPVYWSVSFLLQNHPWESLCVKVDEEHLITNYEKCLQSLSRKSLSDCQVVIDVLVIKLSETSNDFPSIFDELRKAITALQSYFSSVKRVVISITEYACCCFTLKCAIGNATGSAQTIDHEFVLLQIIKDLHTCWEIGQTLAVHELFAFYLTSIVKPESERHLAKFVVSLNHETTHDLFEKEASNVVSKKIMWVSSLVSLNDLNYVDPATARLCHAIHLKDSCATVDVVNNHANRWIRAFSYQHNPFVERIVIHTKEYGYALTLPKPSTPLTDLTPRSALIELTLEGAGNSLDLLQLNNGYFPNLTHLSVVGGQMTGHLDSRRVPSLRTLILDLSNTDEPTFFKVGPLIPDHVQSLIHAGRPWQLVATQEPGGWSLASYDEPFTSPQNNGKEGSFFSPPHLLPLIRELMLVGCHQLSFNEWRSQLNGNPPFESANEDCKDNVLVWAPQCVEKMTVFSLADCRILFKFKKAIPETTRILTSLTCHKVFLGLDGAAFPLLQSLKVNSAQLDLSGAFPHLRSLFFEDVFLKSPWELDARLLQSLSCCQFSRGNFLSMRPQLLPDLSYLLITLREDQLSYPVFLGEEDGLALSRIKHVVFDRRMTLSPFFKKCQLQRVSHLEVSINALQLQTYCVDEAWQCERLTIDVFECSWRSFREMKQLVTVELPPLPRVKTLTATEEDCRVLLNKEMCELTECTVTSPSMLGPQLRCPSLKIIRFTGKLSASDKKHCLNPATYFPIGAQLRMVYFDFDSEAHKMTQITALNENEILPRDGPLQEIDVPPESYE